MAFCKYCGIEIKWEHMVDGKWVAYDIKKDIKHKCKKSPSALKSQAIKKEYIKNNLGKRFRWKNKIEIDKMDNQFKESVQVESEEL